MTHRHNNVNLPSESDVIYGQSFKFIIILLHLKCWECRQMPNFSGNKDLCKLGKEYLNDLLCKFGLFWLQHSKTFDISHAFLRVTIAEL